MGRIEELAELFAGATRDGKASLLATADTLKGVEVEDFPARSRPTNPRNRLTSLTQFRLAVGELAFRPDLEFVTHVRRIPAPDGHLDEDVFVDVAAWCEKSELGDSLAALATFGLHKSSLGAVDPDPLYASQRIVAVVHDMEGALRAFRSRLSARIDAVNVPLPSSDVRQDLSSLRYRILREMLYSQLTIEADIAEDTLSIA